MPIAKTGHYRTGRDRADCSGTCRCRLARMRAVNRHWRRLEAQMMVDAAANTLRPNAGPSLLL
jgi:hypothetical protein